MGAYLPHFDVGKALILVNVSGGNAHTPRKSGLLTVDAQLQNQHKCNIVLEQALESLVAEPILFCPAPPDDKQHNSSA